MGSTLPQADDACSVASRSQASPRSSSGAIPRSGVLKLLDVNLRVWAWHTLGKRAGIDFAYLLWRALNGLEVGEGERRPV